MNVLYHDGAKQWGEGEVLLRQATERLKEVVGPSEDQVTAEWDRTQDEKGRLLYLLKLRDAYGEEAEASFAPEELNSPTHMRVRLYQLWGAVLQALNHTQLREMHEARDREN